MTRIFYTMRGYFVVFCCLNDCFITREYWSFQTFHSGPVWTGSLDLSEQKKSFILRCIVLRKESLMHLSKITQMPESQSKAPPPAAEPNKHQGQAISATQRQPLTVSEATSIVSLHPAGSTSFLMGCSNCDLESKQFTCHMTGLVL